MNKTDKLLVGEAAQPSSTIQKVCCKSVVELKSSVGVELALCKKTF